MPVKKLANAFTSNQNGMLKVQHDADKHNSRTSLASIFEDLASIRKSILGSGTHDNPVRSDLVLFPQNFRMTCFLCYFCCKRIDVQGK